jgi:predicted PurR-regulated permease PerM
MIGWATDTMQTLEDRALLLLLITITLAFLWVLWPFFGAILWALILAIMFFPLCHRLSQALGQRRNLAAFFAVLIILAIFILPLALLAGVLVQEASALYDSIQLGKFNPLQYLQQILDALPAWAKKILTRLGLTDFGSLKEGLSAVFRKGSQFVAAQAVNIGQGTFDFVVGLGVMLYLLFFLLRDGDTLARLIRDAVPLHTEQKRALLSNFAIVVRATVKGDLLVAAFQGALGGLIFWFLGIGAPLLWAALMAFLSLLPAIGSALVWLPVAIYFFAVGDTWRGLILIAYGVFVIGLVDNLLRPLLIGKDTKMPDYVVLLSTLGGLSLFGMQGFVLGPVIAAMFFATWQIFSASRDLQEHIQ